MGVFRRVVQALAGAREPLALNPTELEVGARRVEPPPPDPISRLTAETRAALNFAQAEAQHMRHSSITVGHLLLGLLRDEGSVAASALRALGVAYDQMRAAIVFSAGWGDGYTGLIGLTPHAKRIIELAVYAARDLGQQAIGPEHLLLCSIRDGDAQRMLTSFGAPPDPLRAAVYAKMQRRGVVMGHAW